MLGFDEQHAHDFGFLGGVGGGDFDVEFAVAEGDGVGAKACPVFVGEVAHFGFDGFAFEGDAHGALGAALVFHEPEVHVVGCAVHDLIDFEGAGLGDGGVEHGVEAGVGLGVGAEVGGEVLYAAQHEAVAFAVALGGPPEAVDFDAAFAVEVGAAYEDA